jgi:sugar phosphate permease
MAATAAATSLPVGSLVVAYLLAFLVMVIFYMIPVQIPFLLESLAATSTTRIGLAIACMNLFAATASIQYRRLRARLDYAAIFAAAFLVIGIGYQVIASSDSYGLIVLGLLLAGTGLGVLMPNLNVWLVSFVPRALRGRAVGGLTSCFFLGQFFSPLVLRPVNQVAGIAGGYRVAGIALLVVALAITIHLRHRHHSARADEDPATE